MTNPLQKAIETLADRMAEEGARVRATIEAGLTQTKDAQRLSGARPVPMANVTASRLLWGGPTRVVGWNLYAAGGPVRLLLHDGRDTGADVIGVIDLATFEHDAAWFGPGGISLGEALFGEIVGTGTLTGAVYLGAVD